MKKRIAAIILALMTLSGCASGQITPGAVVLSKTTTAAKTASVGDPSKLIINEICAKNKSVLKDADGDFSDWVEIYNPSAKTVNLSGCGLSDDEDQPLKWVFPSVEIKSKGYLIVFCSDKNRKKSELHTNFKISDGDVITLSSKAKKKISSVTVPVLADDETYGVDKKGNLMILTATPGADNSGSKTSREAAVIAPKFSKESGFYSSQFSLSMSIPDGTEVYYTTDGSKPTKSSKKYTEPFTVKDRSSEKAVLTYKTGTMANKSDEQYPREEFEKATIIRAVAIDKKGRSSPITTATYFVGSKIADKYSGVSVISVVSDPDDLYDPSKGIFVAGNVFTKWRKENPYEPLDGNAQGNYNQRGKEWEREAHIDYFVDGELGFSEDVGMRTHGGWSRDSQQKSLKFYFREDYGDKKLSFELFDDNRDYLNGKKVTEYKRFMIRNGGNDSFSLLYKDPWTQSLVRDFPFATQSDKLVICFIDGEYWGLYTMGEVYDKHYIEENYGIDSDNAVMIKCGALEDGIDSDLELWQDAFDFVAKSDMSKAENYAKLCELFDIDSLTEYIAFELYIGNQDWLENNWAVFRARDPVEGNPYADGKWRFMLYDTEFSMDLYNAGRDYKFDIFTDLAKGEGHLGPMFKSLLKSKEFKAKFVTACEDVMNIAFNPKSASTALNKYHSVYAPYIPQHFKRYIFWQGIWGIESNRDAWKDWLVKRQGYFPEQMNKVLSLGTKNTNTLSVSIEGKGTVYIDNIPIKFTNSKWSGEYFSGYSISVRAVPANGYEFDGWSGISGADGESFKVNPKQDISLNVKFSKKKG